MAGLKTLDMKIKELWIYPIKSLQGLSVHRILVDDKKRILEDRRFILENEAGELVNAKRSQGVHKIPIRYDDSLGNCEIDGESFKLEQGNKALNSKFSDYLDLKVELKDLGPDPKPDRPFWPGPNLVSEQSLKEMSNWFSGIDRDELIRRFRTNMVLDEPNLPPFWEEELLSNGKGLQFSSVQLMRFRSCERCPVPARDSLSGEPTKGFQKEFVIKREDFRSGLDQFGTKHLYYFSLVSQLGELGQSPEFKLGEEVQILDLQEYSD